MTQPLQGVDSGPAANDKSPALWVVFSVVALGMFMGSVDASIVATALPAIHKSLHASINWAGWSITIYSLGNVVVLPIAGKFSDQYGRRRVFLIGISLFTFASLLCGLSQNIYMLIGFRVLQSVGAGTIPPSAAGIIADHFGKNRDRALGMFSTLAASGQIAGPVFGGLFVAYLSWRWIFFINLPLGALILVILKRAIPESPTVARTRTDVRGLALVSTCILAANCGITFLGDHHAKIYDPLVLVPEIAAAVLLWAFVRHTKRSEEPFIPIKLLRAHGFAAMNSLNLLFGAVGFGAATLVPLYAQQRFHLSALSSGTLLTARGIGSICVGALTAMTLRRVGYRKPMALGFSLVGAGMIVMSAAPRWGLSPYLWLSIAAAITGLGNGISNPASRNACMQLAPEAIGAITGLRQMFNYIGTIFSVSIVTAILNRSHDPGIAQAHVYWVFVAVIALVMLPLVRRVPEHKGSW